MYNNGFQVLDEQAKDKMHELANSHAKIHIPDTTITACSVASKIIESSGLKMQTANMISNMAVKSISNLCNDIYASHTVVYNGLIN